MHFLAALALTSLLLLACGETPPTPNGLRKLTYAEQAERVRAGGFGFLDAVLKDTTGAIVPVTPSKFATT